MSVTMPSYGVMLEHRLLANGVIVEAPAILTGPWMLRHAVPGMLCGGTSPTAAQIGRHR
jgi:hypothetical protein